MVAPAAGAVVLVRFPLSNLSQVKLRLITPFQQILDNVVASSVADALSDAR